MAQYDQTSINIPQLIAVAVVGFLAIRWFMSKPSGSSTSAPATGSSTSRRQHVDADKVEQVAAVLPQLDRRAIAWDLHRNGGNVDATMHKALDGRELETPPPTFQPNLPTQSNVAAEAESSATDRWTKRVPGQGQDLISRYNLQSRVSGKGKEPVLSEEAQRKQNGWSADKNVRADALKRRREEMVLAARRKMMEKDAERV